MYYVYALVDPRTKLPFYIGKGKNDRAKHHLCPSTENVNRYKTNTIRKIQSLGLEVIILKLFQNIRDEATAYEVEALLIETLGRRNIDPDGILTNICVDHRPPKGTPRPSLRGRPSHNRGKPMAEATRAKLSLAKKGSIPWNRGRPHSKETIQKIREAQLGKSYHSPQSLSRLSAANSGARNPNARRYLVIGPDGTRHQTDCLSQFCQEHGIIYRNIKNTLRLGKPLKNGWMAIRISGEDQPEPVGELS